MAGIAFQVATMATCMVLTVDFFIRLIRNTRKNVPTTGNPNALNDPKFKFYLASSAFGFLTIFIRCVYRYVRAAAKGLIQILMVVIVFLRWPVAGVVSSCAEKLSSWCSMECKQSSLM